ncbi:MAG: 1-(5-phosphoribosyl)-5-[(5-phosphoribosylamino) methylideneamino]imidazole-4-carboxamide isomerase [Ginsengibacter sp.]
MIIIPAIDIINGKCVRLTKGDYSTQVVYHDDPLEMAKQFEAEGFERLHIVDLDGAKKGSIQNLSALEKMAGKTKLVIDFGGGIKNAADIDSVFNAGASIVTLGSIAVKKPALIEEWVMEYGASKILIGADVLHENIKIHGWIDDGGINIYAFIGNMLSLGVTDLFCTDISKDGMMEGVSSTLYKKITEEFPLLQFYASGGVTNISDIELLEEVGCKGVIIGKAIYEGAISLKELSKLNSKL